MFQEHQQIQAREMNLNRGPFLTRLASTGNHYEPGFSLLQPRRWQGSAPSALGSSRRLLYLPREISPELRANRNAIQQELRQRDQHSRDRAAALAYGGLGLFLGLGLGAAGGLSRQSTRAAFTGAIVGLVLGGLAGGAATSLVLPSYHAARAATPEFEPGKTGPKPEDMTSDLGLALLTHGSIWAAVGGAAGLALGLGLGGAAKTCRAIVGGILGRVWARSSTSSPLR